MFRVTLLAALAAFAVSPAFAQDGATGMASAVTTTTAATTGGAGQAAGQQDKMFVEKAAVGGMFEVQSSQAATTKGQSDAVKQFAQKMVADHTKANEELKALAQGKGMTVPAQLDEQHQKMMDRLNKAEGEEFDSTYGRMQNRAHNEAVKLFENAANTVQDPELKAFATKTLPTLKAHQQEAKGLPGADQAGKGGGKKKDKN